MGTGFTGIRQVAAVRAEQAAQYTARNYIFFKLVKEGDSAVVRFLEQGEEVAWAHVNKVKTARDLYPRWVVSRDQANGVPCPMQEAGLPRSYRAYLFLIWRDAPLVKRDSDGKALKNAGGGYVFDGVQDQLAHWEVHPGIIDELEGLDAAYKGLSSRDFKITRRGQKPKVTYPILPADPDGGPQPMSAADVALAATKPDLKTFTTPMSYEALTALVRTGVVSTNQENPEARFDEAVSNDSNPFMSRR